jgi:beta-lactamase class A
VRTLGDRVTRLDRIEPELNSAIPGHERDTKTSAAICSDMQRLLLGDALSEHPAANSKTGYKGMRPALP